MAILVHPCTLDDIAPMRAAYQQAMGCQIIHESIHTRPGWTREFLLQVDGMPVGYGSLAVAGPWTGTRTLYECFVLPSHRTRLFTLFAALRAACDPDAIETQTNDRLLTLLLHTFADDVRAESILFEDAPPPARPPIADGNPLSSAGTAADPFAGVRVRDRLPADTPELTRLELDPTADAVLTQDDEIVGAGGVLTHYNPPYGDVFMAIAAPYRRRGLGTWLVRQLKQRCRAAGLVPAARCRTGNVASRATLQRAGFVPCGHLLHGRLR